MKVEFKTRKLQKEYEQGQKAIRTYGQQVARKYVQRINLIMQAQDIEELQALPGLNCHPLKADRKGQWAVKLTGPYRLIFTLRGDCLNIVCIEEVSNHYGD